MRDLILTMRHNFQAVIEQHARQLCGHDCHIDSRVRICLADNWQRSDMIHMCMAHNDCIQPALFLYRAEIRQRVLRAGLADTAVQKKAFSACLHIYAAGANLHGAAQKNKFHMYLIPFLK